MRLMEDMKPFRVVRADEIGIRGTVIEKIIRENRCIICANYADREVWMYSPDPNESKHKVQSKNYACCEECAEMIAWRS